MMRLFLVSCSLFLNFKVSLSTFGIDLSTACYDWSCMLDSGTDFMITRGWMSYGAFDSTSITNLDGAQSAGIPYTDVYMFPCPGLSASQQMIDLINDLASGAKGLPVKSNFTQRSGVRYARGLQAGFTREEKERRMRGIRDPPKHKIVKRNGAVRRNSTRPSWRPEPKVGASYGMIWLDIEDNPSDGCSWADYSSASNCQYVTDLATAGEQNGAVIGIYSSQYEWSVVMGSSDYCTGLTSYPLWYAHYDGSESFDDYPSVAFGGWTTPAMKQFEGDATLCGYDIDGNYY